MTYRLARLGDGQSSLTKGSKQLQEKKLPRLAEMLSRHFNFPAVYKGLGLAS